LIDDIDEQYTADQLKYIYYHLGWLYLDLTSRETEYVDEFARNYLNLGIELLPLIQNVENPDKQVIQACFKAYQELNPISTVAGRYFYKRYRSLLLSKLKATKSHVPGQIDRLKREATLLLENWSEGESDTLDYLSQMASPELRPLFPHLIAEQIDPQLEVALNLPTDTDRRLWQHVFQQTEDHAAANTLYRLKLLDKTDVYRPLPVELMLEFVHRFCSVKFAQDETVIWQDERNDDVYILIEGELAVLITQDNQTDRVSTIFPGEMFGEIAFFTENPRSATVRAVKPSQCFVLTDADLQLLAFEHPTILMQMAGTLAKRLVDIYETGRIETV
jgi:hypothetical protein